MHRAPWHNALDMQLETLSWHRTRQGLGYIERLCALLNVEKFLADRIESCLLESLHRGDTCFITSDMLHIAMQAAADLPEDFVFDDHSLMSRAGFLLFEEPLQVKDKNNRDTVFHAMSWVHDMLMVAETAEIQPVVWLYFFSDMRDESDDVARLILEITGSDPDARALLPPHLMYSFCYPLSSEAPLYEPFDIKLQDNPGAASIKACLSIFVAIQLLARQTIGEPVKMLAPRSSRRRAEREDFPLPEKGLITLITLRRKSVKREEDLEPVKWSRRWMVTGHWRKQWYPSTKTHGWVYIYEYVKGPEDKPLILRERRVFNFVR